MKLPRWNTRGKSTRREAPRRARRLFVEELERRTLLAGDVYDFGVPPEPVPPDSYRSPKLSDKLAEVSYEFDRWAASNPTRPFVPSDPVIRVSEGRVSVEAITTSSSQLSTDLVGIGCDVISVGSTGVSAWVPLSEIESLPRMSDLAFAGPELDVAQNAAGVGATGNLTAQGADSTGQVITLNGIASPATTSIPRLPNVSDMLTRVAYEFDQWAASNPTRDFNSLDPYIQINAGRVAVEATSAPSVSALVNELQSIGGQIIATSDPLVSAWVPLSQIENMGGLHDLLFAKPPLGATVIDVGLSPQPMPPDSYRSSKIGDSLAELAYEYDQWLNGPLGYEFGPSDSTILLNGHLVCVEAVTTGSSAALADELQAIGATVDAVVSGAVSCWLPIGDIESLPSASDLLFAQPVTSLAVDMGHTYSPLDVNLDGQIAPNDALSVISALNGQFGNSLSSASNGRLDVNRDGFIAPSDLVPIINFLNANSVTVAPASQNGGAEGEAAVSSNDVDALAALADDLAPESLAGRKK
jgi:dockerin type I repeat protein